MAPCSSSCEGLGGLLAFLRLEAEHDRNFTMVNMFRILDHDPCCTNHGQGC